jgi:hypothetical protein
VGEKLVPDIRYIEGAAGQPIQLLFHYQITGSRL